MNRTIKFRGLRTDGNGWVYGDLWREPLRFGSKCQIYVADGDEEIEDTGWVQVTHSSIGQFTCLTDKNGVEIYEGDKVLSFKTPYEYGPSINTVEFINGCIMLVCIGKSDIPLYNYKHEHLEVIGNIHENK